MTHTESELHQIKINLSEMWDMVLSQVEKSRNALVSFDKNIAREIGFREKMVDVFELKIDRDCENAIALLTPVAVDLRMVLSVLKINTNLERIADFARTIARFIEDAPKISYNEKLISVTRVIEIFDHAIEMLKSVREAWDKEISSIAFDVIAKDNLIDEAYNKAPYIIADYIKEQPNEIIECLNVHSIIRKIERIGDHCSNIAEEIIFYLDAKIVKHPGIQKNGEKK
jgi:phosphate transport system protein